MKEFRNSKYNFTNDEKRGGVELNLFGYKNNPNEKIINQKEGTIHMRVGDYEVWVPENSFKPGELSWIYNEIFTPRERNPHAYENEELMIERGDYVIDAGACEGFFIRYALQKGAKTIIAFEPLKTLVNGLNLTYEKEIDKKRVIVIDMGLSNREEITKFDSRKDHICEAKIDQQGTNKCEVISLDQFMKSKVIDKINFIKMDIEGTEILAIKGAKRTIKEHKPKLSIAVYHDYENAHIIKDLLMEYRPDYKIFFGGCYTFEKPYRPFMLYAY